ncbi:flagellar basal body rod protein FlgC [Methylobacterium sp. Leaf118]|uniref:flagellar basal body rod protein FlgC n=1 Tax=Methylobacterium sp. Leaf118 TaxID=2876562 RepID=UPI001E4EA989|nr:flagellar basal body rod protein FlgC [Methylobacterium sp. Leaf118]
MIDPLLSASRLAAAGLQAQSVRMRVVSENLANAQSTGETPGSEPYARKTVTFMAELDRAAGAASVRLSEIGTDKTPFRTEHDPGNPAADENGVVKLPNVNMLVEMADMREANRSYEANLQVIKQARAMVASVIDLLKS